MKKLVFLFLAVGLIACNSNDQSFTIEIDMQDLAGATVVLNRNAGGELSPVDSVTLDDQGKGTITGSVSSSEMMYLGESGTRRNLQIFMDNNNYNVTGTMEDVNITSDGGPHNDFNDYKESTSSFQDRQMELSNMYQQASRDSVTQDSLQAIVDEFYAINDEKDAFDSIYIYENPASPLSAYILRGKSYSLNAEELENWLGILDESLGDNTYYNFMNDRLQVMKKVEVGQMYTDIALPDTLGNEIKLSDFAGKGVLLIDFWAAWCGPCRRANPGVVELYNEFHDKGFDIVGVSLDRNREDWLKAIKDDNLTWHHMSDLKFWDSEGAKLYAVSAIPHTVLLDKDGTIIAKNLSKEELKSKLEELL